MERAIRRAEQSGKGEYSSYRVTVVPRNRRRAPYTVLRRFRKYVGVLYPS